MKKRFKGMILAGALVLGYTATTVLWREPASDLYARWQQGQLAHQLDRATAAYAAASRARVAWDGRLIARQAGTSSGVETRELSKGAPAPPRVGRGRALARLSVPRIGLRTIVVEGTRPSDLRKGPGHYEMTAMPGAGKLVAIAGHRTTFGAPFRHIDELRSGDVIGVSTVYGSFRYRVFAHEIVAKDDWTIIRPRRFETLVLSACHPLYSARQRWVVYARLVASDVSS